MRSRSFAIQLIQGGFVTGHKNRIKPSTIAKKGEVYFVSYQDLSIYEIEPYKFDLNIVYEDDDLMIINKPSGLVVHPSAGHWQNTLVNALYYHAKKLSSGSHPSRPGIVHRIDKDTSGLLVVAKNDSAHAHLSEQFKTKVAKRTYWAIAHGEFKKASGTMRSYLRRHPKDRKKFSSIPTNIENPSSGKLAITHFRCTKKSGLFSFVICQLETGRTHQIRVHLTEMGHPIVGDPIYSSRQSRSKSLFHNKILKLAPHLLLHAAELTLMHPRTNKIMTFSAPWPEECMPFLKATHLDSQN